MTSSINLLPYVVCSFRKLESLSTIVFATLLEKIRNRISSLKVIALSLSAKFVYKPIFTPVHVE